MKNFEKYKTPEEAFTAQVQFCQKQSNDENNCHKNGCKYSTGTTPCLLQWLYDEAEGEKEGSFCEKIEWHKVKKRPMTEEEKQEYAEMDIYGDEIDGEIYEGIMPDDGQEILVKTRWGAVSTDIAYVDGYYVGLESIGDWEDVEYWAEMPKGELKND